MNRSEKRKLAKLSKKKGAELSLSKEELAELAINLLHNENYSDADKVYSRIIAYNDNDSSAFHFAGIVKYKLGKYEEALKLIDKSISISPEYAEAYNSKGIILFQQSMYEESKIYFQSAVQINQCYDNAFLNLGNAHYELDETNYAISSYEKSLSLNNNNIESAYKLSGLCLSIDDADSALEYANHSLQINSNCQHALAYKAIANWSRGDNLGWKELYNYEDMIYQVSLNTPIGFSSIEEFNKTLANDIYKHKTLIWEPLERVTNGGAVTSDLLTKPTRSFKCLERSITKAIGNLQKTLINKKENSFNKIIPSRYKMTLIGSILKERGAHPPHVHENSCLSGVYYVDIPDFINDNDSRHSGWLEFGRPNIKMKDDHGLPLTSRCPKAGTMLLFPSYFFHGTIPFEKESNRIGIAFDLYPV